MSYHSGVLSWSKRRQLTILSGGILAALVFFVLPSYFILRDRPACTNGAKDEGEKGVDCGGKCALLCEGEALAPLVHYARALPVGERVFSAAAYLENRNPDAGAKRGTYLLKVYDSDNILVGAKAGDVFIPPHKAFAVFEGNMEVGDRIPVRATFEWKNPLRFERMERDPLLEIAGKHFEQIPEGSRLEATLYNPNLFSIGDVKTVALLFDESGNIYAASETELRGLQSRANALLSFTWGTALQAPARIEVLYTVPGRN